MPFRPVLALTALLLAAPSPRRAAGAEGEPGAPRMRGMTFNIRYGTARDGENAWPNRRELVFDVIRREAADFVGLQEALRFQIDEILRAASGYAEVGVGRQDGRIAGEYSAILFRHDRWAVDQAGTLWLSDTPHEPGSATWGNRIPRIVTWARFVDKATGAAVFVFNTHFDHQSQPSRERSAAMLARLVADRRPQDPAIVTGDFNAGEDNPAILYLSGAAADAPVRLTDTFRALHPDATDVGTFNGFAGRRDGPKIDYVFVTPGVEVLEAAIVRDQRDGRYPSDHFPVTAAVRLR